MTAPLNGYPPGSPHWWLYYLVQQLISQQHRYDVLEDYHMGNHPLPKVDPKHVSAVKKFQQMAQTNYITLVNSAPVGRMRVKDFTFGAGGAPDPEAKKIWSVNDMDLQSKKAHSAGSIFGDCYVLVGPPDVRTGMPTMTVEDPRVAIVEPDPLWPTRSVAGLRMWKDIYMQHVIAVLYLPDMIYTFKGPSLVRNVQQKTSITDRLIGHGTGTGAFDLLDQQPNEIGEIPLVHFEWQPDYNAFSLAEAELVLHVQDRINQMILDRLIIASSQAFNQRWAKGVAPEPQKSSGSKIGPVNPPFEMGASNLWVTPNPDAEFGQFDAVDFKQILEAVRDDIADIAAITQTPAHYLMNRFVNVSGETLTQTESGFVSKIKLRMEAMGWGWERSMRVAFKYLGLAKADEPEVTVLWADPLVRQDVDAADAASKWIAGGLELGLAMDRFGDFSSEQIAYAREQKQTADDLAQQQADAANQAKADAVASQATSQTPPIDQADTPQQ